MRNNSKLLAVLLALLCLVFYQNCADYSLFNNGDNNMLSKPLGSGPADGDGYTGRDDRIPGSGPADGDGYAGMQIIYPEASESGGSFDINVTQRVPDEYFNFEVVTGGVEIEVSPNGQSARVVVDDTFIGNVQIKVMSSTGESEIIEIQIFPPQSITSANLHYTFGSKIVSAGGITFISSTKAAVRNVAQAGKVSLWKRNSMGKMRKIDTISSPIVRNPDGSNSVLFGTGLSATGRDLLVGTMYSNKVYYYYRNTSTSTDYQKSSVVLKPPQQFVDKNGDPIATPAEKKRFGTSIMMYKRRVFVRGTNVIHVYSRKAEDKGESTFSYKHTLAGPEGYIWFGRNVQYRNGVLLVSGSKKEADGSKRGVVHVYFKAKDSWDMNYRGTIAPKNVTGNFGLKSHSIGKTILISQYGGTNNPTTPEFVRRYAWDFSKKRFKLIQEIKSPFNTAVGFGLSFAVHGNDLYVGAPRAKTTTNPEGGFVLIYSRSSYYGQYKENGKITPNFEEHPNPRSMGYSMNVYQQGLFIGIRNRDMDRGVTKGNVYRIPLN